MSASGETKIYTDTPFTGSENDQFKPTGAVTAKTQAGADVADDYSGTNKAKVNPDLTDDTPTTPTEPETPAAETFKVTLNASVPTGYTATLLNAKGTPATAEQLAEVKKGDKVTVLIEKTTGTTDLDKLAIAITDVDGTEIELASTAAATVRSAAITVNKNQTITVDVHEKQGYWLTLDGTLANSTNAATVEVGDGDAENYTTAIKIAEGTTVKLTKGGTSAITDGTTLYLKSTKTTKLADNTVLGKAVVDSNAVEFVMPASDLTLTEANFAQYVATHYDASLTLTATAATADYIVETDTANHVIYTNGTSTTFDVSGAANFMVGTSKTVSSTDNSGAKVSGTDQVTTIGSEQWVKPIVKVTISNTAVTSIKSSDTSKWTLRAASITADEWIVPGTIVTITPGSGKKVIAYPTADEAKTLTEKAVVGKWTVPAVATTLNAGYEIKFTDDVKVTLDGKAVTSGVVVKHGITYEVITDGETTPTKKLVIVPTGGTGVAEKPAATVVVTTALTGNNTVSKHYDLVAWSEVKAGTAVTASGEKTIGADGVATLGTTPGKGYIADLTNAAKYVVGTELYVIPAAAGNSLTATGTELKDEKVVNSSNKEVYSFTVGAKNIVISEQTGSPEYLTISVTGVAGKTAKVSKAAIAATNSADTLAAAITAANSEIKIADNGKFVKIDGDFVSDAKTYLGALDDGAEVEIDFGYYQVTPVTDVTSAAVINGDGSAKTAGKYTVATALESGTGELFTDNKWYVKKAAVLKMTFTYIEETITNAKDSIAISATNSTVATSPVEFVAATTENTAKTATFTTFTDNVTITIEGSNS